MKEGNKRHLAHDLLNVWLMNSHAYDIREALKVFPTLAAVALEHLEARSSSFRTADPHQMAQLVDALAMDKRKSTARAILTLFNRGRLSGAWLTGAAFEQINWTLGGGPADSAQGSQGRSNDEQEGSNPI